MRLGPLCSEDDRECAQGNSRRNLAHAITRTCEVLADAWLPARLSAPPRLVAQDAAGCGADAVQHEALLGSFRKAGRRPCSRMEDV